jgi:putative sigma-54 modulation protein
MRIDVVGKHLEVTPAIQEYAQKKVEKLTKIFDGTQQIKVYVESPQGKAGEFNVEVVVTVVKHEEFVAKAAGPDMYATIDTATEKALRQIRDFKDKLRSSPVDRR